MVIGGNRRGGVCNTGLDGCNKVGVLSDSSKIMN